MKHKLLALSVVLFLILGACDIGSAQLESLARPLFPLEKGSYWVYEGTTSWTDAKSQKVLTKKVSCTMTVTDVITHGEWTIAIVKGHPQDLIWDEAENQPGDYMIAKNGPKYYLLTDDHFEEVMSRLANPDDDLADLIQDDALFLEESPSGIAKAFGEPEQLARSDWSYFWYVENVSPADLKDLKGTEMSGEFMQYRLAYRTLPDDVQMDVVPGLGITRYIYTHHGTVAQADVRLIEYFAPNPA